MVAHSYNPGYSGAHAGGFLARTLSLVRATQQDPISKKQNKTPNHTLHLSKGWCHVVYSMEKTTVGIKVHSTVQPLMSHGL